MAQAKLRINTQIRTSPVRLIDADNKQIGIIDTNQALNMAREANLDLVEIAPTSTPPVCRIMDFGKHLYELKRKQKQNTKKQHTVTLKEIRLRPKIDQHDRDTKIGHARKFIEKGHRVQFTMLFRGREMLHIDHGKEVMNEVVEMMADIAKVDRPAVMLGRRMTLVIAPNK